MKVISKMTALRMPTPVKMPKVRIVAMSNTTSEKKPIAATAPAIIMTGPTPTSDRTTASTFASLGVRPPEARSASYSS